MISRIFSASIVGVDAVLIAVEAYVHTGLPSTIIVGLPDAAVQESRERIKSAIRNSGFTYPIAKVSLNLAPADVPKNGTVFDVAGALAVLQGSGQAIFNAEDKLFIGELSLDGRIQGIPGALAIALSCKENPEIKELYLPWGNAAEVSLIQGHGITLFAIDTLANLLKHLTGVLSAKPIGPDSFKPVTYTNSVSSVTNLSDINGQRQAKRALEIACAGNHNILLYGPPGSGKTLLAKAMPSILPALDHDEILELTKIYSIAGKLGDSILGSRPVRAPHHTISYSALVGGGANPKPGEITLANKGVLYLDELPEFSRHILETLRQPLEEGAITISRSRNTVTFPARFLLVASMNPCPCGYFGDPEVLCKCSRTQIMNYQKRISGPLLDRIDLHVSLGRQSYEQMRTKNKPDESVTIRKRVDNARATQLTRFKKTNSEMTIADMREFCGLDDTQHALLRKATQAYKLSGRGIHRVLKVARTIADLEQSQAIQTRHLAEALQYRSSVSGQLG